MVLGCFVLTVSIWALNVATFKHSTVSAKELRSMKRSKDINEGTPPPITIIPVNEVKEKKTLRVTPPEKAQLKGKRKPRGVTVNRRAIIENVTLEDLRAPEGRLWIPAAMVGPVNPDASDPFINVAVAYCQLDMTSYHETPWLFAMGTFHQLHSGCLSDPSLVKTYRLSSLAVSSYSFDDRYPPQLRCSLEEVIGHNSKILLLEGE